MEQKPDEDDKRLEKPEGCPGKWQSGLNKVCFDCLAKNPRIVCPERTPEEIKEMIPNKKSKDKGE